MKALTDRQADEYLHSFINLERGRDQYSKRTYRLDRMEFLLDRFGHPERAFESIHIAGSKGKGSTAVMIASVLEAAGYTVGLFTSPHILDIRERVRINRAPITPHLYRSILAHMKSGLDSLSDNEFPGGIRPTFFEIMVLLGFLAFQKTRCRYAVIEVGLGGRLDATNVVTPLVSLITHLELEHEEILGNTLEQVTAEKCGIIKTGRPVFSSAQEACARKTIREAASAKQAPLEFVDDAVSVTVENITLRRTRIALTLDGRKVQRFSLMLIGEAQAENAALVFLTLSRLFPRLRRRIVKKGLRRALLPGRMETAGRRPLIVLDGAHTPASASRTASLATRLLSAPRILLFAAVQGKKYAAMAAVLAPHFDSVIISTPGTFKPSEPGEVSEAFRRIHPRVVLVPDPHAALQEALTQSAGRRPILVTGSYYFIAEIKKALKQKTR